MAKIENLNFKVGNPGAVRFGNFINYYKFHPPEERIKLLPKNIWNKNEHKEIVLDLGCNAGDLTLTLYDFIVENISPNCCLYGIDVDPTLIIRANEQNIHPNINFECLDIMNDENTNDILNRYLEDKGTSKFTTIFCFSMTMWIHLNHGDEGLKKFLKKLSTLTEVLVIEPQPWKCYKTAVKRLKLSKEEFPLFKELQIRESIEEEIEAYLTENCNAVKIHESGRTQWGRKLLFFKFNVEK